MLFLESISLSFKNIPHQNFDHASSIIEIFDVSTLEL